MTFLVVLLAGFTVLVFIPVSLLALQVAMAVAARRMPATMTASRPRVAVLVPAHNEAAIIADTLASVLPQIAKGDRVLVIADNCSDDTASIARKLGAMVVERNDPAHRGKDHALDFGVRQLRQDPPDVVIIIDADCLVHPGTIDRLARACASISRPVQALYEMRSPVGADPKIRIAEFAWIVKSQVRPLGNLRLGIPCQLMGTGMAFPWEAISKVALVSGYLAEDMKFGVDLALAGYPALFCPEARVTSYFPRDMDAADTQRTRWEHGHLNVILREVPRLLADSLRRRNPGLLGLAADLAVAPLTLLALIVVLMLPLNMMLLMIAGTGWPLFLSLATFGLFSVSVFAAWHGWGRKVISFLSLLMVPYYMLSKIPLYLRFLTRRQSAWIKTGRN